MSDTSADDRPSALVVAVQLRQSDSVLRQAAALAKDLGAELVCAHVNASRFPVEERPDGTVVSEPFDPDLPDISVEEFDPELNEQIRAILDPLGVSYSVRALAGDPARALGHLASTVNARLIIVGTHPPGLRRSVHDFINGSVAVHLAHHQHRPVVVVPLSPVAEGQKFPWD